MPKQTMRQKVVGLITTIAIGTTTLVAVTAASSTPATAASGTVSGIVYRDWNYSGTTTERYGSAFVSPSTYLENRNWPEAWWNTQPMSLSDPPKRNIYLRSQEPGEPGITIIVTDTAGARWSGTTAADGTFSISVPTAATNAVRVEEIIPASKSYLVVGPKGAMSNGNVQFVNLGSSSTGLYFSVANPSEYCKHDSSAVLRLITPCFKFGDQKSTTAMSVLESVPFDTPTSLYASPPLQISEATTNQIGTTFGLAWDPYRKNLFAAAFMRRHAGFGPFGTGAIYKIAGPGSGAKSVSVWADLNALFGAGTAGADPHPTGAAGCSGTSVFNPAVHAGSITACENDWGHDIASFDKVGKISLGDMDVSEDGANLFVVNMADKKIYRMSTTTTPTASSDVQTLTIPVAASGTSNKCASADSRPMAITIHDGVGYVGVTCSQESGAAASDPRGYVYKFDPVAMTATAAPVLNFLWSYNKSEAGVSFTNNTAWTSAWTAATPYGGDWPHEHKVEPIISSIVFDDNDLIVGMRNRNHDQLAQNAFTLNPADTTTRVNPSSLDGGDIVRACRAGTSWAAEGDTAAGWAENNCTGGYFTGWSSGSATAYGTTSLYDRWFRNATQGSMVMLAGSQSRRADLYAIGGTTSWLPGGKLIHTRGDPSGSWYSGGISSFSPDYGWDVTGGASSATTYSDNDGSNANIFAEPGYSDSVVPSSTMGKTNGLGDLEVLCLYAPIDIGDRLWRDNNADGLQTAGEPGINEVTVRLMQGTSILDTAITDTNGKYLFSGRTGTSTSSSRFGITNLKPGQNGLYVKVDLADSDIPSGFHLTALNTGSNGRIDSDGQADGGTTAFNIATSYSQSFDFDFGFTSTVGVTAGDIYAIGDRVWADTNDNGVQDSGETGVNGVTVSLLDNATSAVLATTTTDGSGLYAFDSVAIGTYKVAFTPLVSGDTWATQSVGSDRTVDSDAGTTTGLTGTITIAASSTSLRSTTSGDRTTRATKIDATVDAGRKMPTSVIGTTVCLTPT
jgi:SdrD B-like domain